MQSLVSSDYNNNSNNKGAINSASFYERAISAQLRREKKLSIQREEQFRQECTFTASRNRTATTTTTSWHRTPAKSAATSRSTGSEPGYSRPTRAALDRFREFKIHNTGNGANSVASTSRNQTVRQAGTLGISTRASISIKTTLPSRQVGIGIEFNAVQPEKDEISHPVVDRPKHPGHYTGRASAQLRDPTVRQDESYRTPTKPNTQTAKSPRTGSDRTTGTSRGTCVSSPEEEPNGSVLYNSPVTRRLVTEAIPSHPRRRDPTMAGHARSSVVVSRRIEDLYQQQVTKMRLQPKTLSEERLYRHALYDQRELDQCTFQPHVRQPVHHLYHDHGTPKRGETLVPESSAVPQPAFHFTRTPRRSHSCDLKRVAALHRYSATSATEIANQQPRSVLPAEIVFEVDPRVDLISIMHPFEPHHGSLRLSDLDDDLTMTTLEALGNSVETTRTKNDRHLKPEKDKPRQRSRHRRVEQIAEPEYGSI